MTGEEALLRLKSGNARFAAGESIHPHLSADWRRQLAHGARPFATVLACSDPSAPPELVFDQGLGDLFVIRVAGNFVAPEVLGSIQFAGAHLGTRLFVVLGHEGCATVRAALEARCHGSRQASQIERVMQYILPALRELPPSGQDATAELPAAVEANVRHSVRQLREMPEARKGIERGAILIVGAVSDVRSGMVRFVE